MLVCSHLCNLFGELETLEIVIFLNEFSFKHFKVASKRSYRRTSIRRTNRCVERLFQGGYKRALQKIEKMPFQDFNIL